MISQNAFGGELRTESVSSPSLGRDVKVLVYLPDGYENGRLRYPVLYLLHGANADEKAWVDFGHIREKADALIASGKIPPAIIVMPGCPSMWWVDGANDKAESAFWMDIVPAVGKRYRTIETRGGRLLAGLSAGGYGAVRYGLRYPEKVAAVAALSPAVYAKSPPATSAARINPPFLHPDGKFNQKSWEEHNYPQLIEGYFAQPLRLPFYLVSGDNDSYGIAFETALLFKQLYERQPDLSELRVVDGGHSWSVWEPAINDALAYVFKFAERPQTVTGATTTTAASRLPPHVKG